VLQPEYRGSTGYGTEFLDAIYQHFGDRAYRDVDNATDYADGRWPEEDPTAFLQFSAVAHARKVTTPLLERDEGEGMYEFSEAQ
jgi:dipeptidyl aminopeptidase/acylaminoacyl peptidase